MPPFHSGSRRCRALSRPPSTPDGAVSLRRRRRSRCSITCAATSRTKASARPTSARDPISWATSSTPVPFRSERRARPIATPGRRARPIRATTPSSRRRPAGPGPSTSVPTTACCMPSTTRWRTAARKPGRTFRRRSSATAIRTTRRMRPPRHFNWAHSLSGAAGFRCTRTSSMSTRRRAWPTSISRIRILRRRRRPATIGGPFSSADLAREAAPSMRSTLPIRSPRRRPWFRPRKRPPRKRPPPRRCCGSTRKQIWATCTTRRRSPRRTPTAGWCSWRPGTTIPAARVSSTC